LAQEINPQTRTMLITTFGTPEIEEQVLEMGAIYLPKPFRLLEFAATVERILDDSQQIQ